MDTQVDGSIVSQNTLMHLGGGSYIKPEPSLSAVPGETVSTVAWATGTPSSTIQVVFFMNDTPWLCATW